MTDQLLASGVLVQIFGWVILTCSFVYAIVSLFELARRQIAARNQSAQQLLLLRQKIETEKYRSNVSKSQTEGSWSGNRKFRIQKKINEALNVFSFYLVPHDGKGIPKFEPGQFLTFTLKLPQGNVVRCYSLSDSPTVDGHYRVSIKRCLPPPKEPDAPPGLISSYFHEQLNEGDVVDVKAPSGHFYLDMSSSRPVVLIAGGIGITPMYSMLKAACDAGARREIWLFYGMRNGEEFAFKDAIRQLDAENDNVRVVAVFSAPEDSDQLGVTHDHEGRLGLDLFKELLPSNNYEFYMCGPPPMMESVCGGLAEWGVPESSIHTEAFGPASVKKTRTKVASDQATHQVLFAKSGITVQWDGATENLLELAEQNNVQLDSGCRAGGCGTCLTAIKSGEVDYPRPPDADPEPGSCLACVAVPKSDLELDA